MIRKVDGYNTKYELSEPVTEQEIREWLGPQILRLRCLIMNKETAKKLLDVTPGDRFVTINNTVPSGVVYVNRLD